MSKPSIAKLLEQNSGTLPAYAWPGGYDLVYYDGHNETLCATCATEAQDDPEEWDDWKPQGCFIHYEGSPVFCSQCNAVIESAYGDPEADTD